MRVPSGAGVGVAGVVHGVDVTGADAEEDDAELAALFGEEIVDVGVGEFFDLGEEVEDAHVGDALAAAIVEEGLGHGEVVDALGEQCDAAHEGGGVGVADAGIAEGGQECIAGFVGEGAGGVLVGLEFLLGFIDEGGGGFDGGGELGGGGGHEGRGAAGGEERGEEEGEEGEAFVHGFPSALSWWSVSGSYRQGQSRR